MTLQFDEYGFALTSGEITVYTADHNGIFSHKTTEYISEGGSLAAGSYLDAPPKDKTGFVIVRQANGWGYVADNRGTYYNTETGEQVEHTELGELPQHLTQIKPLDVPCKWNGSQWVKDEVKITALFTQRKEILLSQLANRADQLKTGLLVGYPQTEIESFYRQEKEALAWQANHDVDTPMLTQIAKLRGMPFETLVQKVIEKSNQFAVAIGVIIGQRQKFEDRLLALSTIEQLDELEKDINEWQFQAS